MPFPLKNCAPGRNVIAEKEGGLAAKSAKPLSRYLRATRAPFYSVILTLPLMLLYEVMILYFRFDRGHYIRNAADVWIKYLIKAFGVHGTFAFGVIILIFVSFGFVSMVREKQDINFKYALLAILESSIYAWLLAILASRLASFVAIKMMFTQDAQAKFVLSVGAGVYEELIFRAIGYGFVANALAFLFRLPDRKKKQDKRRQRVNQRVGLELKIFAAVASSLIFAWLHNVSASLLNDYTTAYRFSMGLLFCLIYEFRGLGVAVWTHALYDILVFSVS